MSHTAGEWEHNGNAVHKRLSPHYATCVCVCEGEQRHANAKLIAQAPAMLEALRDALAWYGKDRWIDEYNGVKPNPMLLENIKKAEAIIRKAAGDE